MAALQLKIIQVVEPAAHTSCFVFHVVTMDLDTSIICIVNFITMWSFAMLCDRVHEVASETHKIWSWIIACWHLSLLWGFYIAQSLVHTWR